MNCLRHEKGKKLQDNIFTDVTEFFLTKKEMDDNAINDIRNLLRLKKENEPIND